MISDNTLKAILGISGKVSLDEREMIRDVSISLFPKRSADKEVFNFTNELIDTLANEGVKVLSFNDVWIKVSISNRINRFVRLFFSNIKYLVEMFFRKEHSVLFIDFKTILKLSSSKKIKDGVSILVDGDLSAEELPMQYIRSFKTNSIITVIKIPDYINDQSTFKEHFDTSMNMFSYHMTNIVIGVSKNRWLVYNFNGSHPIYVYPDAEFSKHVISSIIPKIAAPITPHKLSEFVITEDRFDIEDSTHEELVSDMIEGSKLFESTNLYPAGKKIDDLFFRKDFHKIIGKLHLDSRNGMSFGYIAKQMPVRSFNNSIKRLKKFKRIYPNSFKGDSDLFINNSIMYIKLNLFNELLVLRVPDVWVITTRSGSNKTNFNKKSDIIKMGLVSGRLHMRFPKDVDINHEYKPSFDTKVILAHCLGNAILYEILKYNGISNTFTNTIKKFGYAICHWHGYFNKNLVPQNTIMYGRENPHVSCSSPQSAIYAIRGKFDNIISKADLLSDYCGDIHIEPHHGINVNFKSIKDLAEYILNNPDCTVLGNKYL